MSFLPVCNFPGCNNETKDYDDFFRKYYCRFHAFDKVVWPKLNSKKDENYNKILANSGQRPQSKKWGKRYFK